MLIVAVVATAVVDGPVGSFSALFYTPGRTMFTGALCAVALALVALSGHSVEQVLLDVAAPFAAVIAVVPTPVGPGDVPGPPLCRHRAVCVPPGELPGVTVGILTLAVVGAAGVVTAVVLTLRRHALDAGTVVGLAAAVVAIVGMPVWLAVSATTLLALGHLVGAGVFFGIMAAVSVLSAVTARGRLRAVYVVVAAGIAASLVYLTTVFLLRRGGAALSTHVPWVLIGEAVLIGMFSVLWIAQTVQKWNEVNPAVMRSGIQAPT